MTIRHLPVDDTLIPTGTIENFPLLQAEQTFVLKSRDPVIDHCFVLDEDAANIPIDTRSRQLQLLASLSHPSTKTHLDVFSTEPAFQVYTGDYIDIPAKSDLSGYGPRSGICIEPGRYINAINVPEWRNMVLLRRGQNYGARTVYKAWKY